MSPRSTQLGRDRARQQVAAGMVGMAEAHVTVGVDDVLVGEDAVGNHELARDPVEIAHGLSAGYVETSIEFSSGSSR